MSFTVVVRNGYITNTRIYTEPNSKYEIWHDELIQDAYHRLFDEAQNKKVQKKG